MMRTRISSRLLRFEIAVMDICLVVAVAQNRVIGREGGLPWKLPSDLRHFRRITLGHPIVMGRRTHESIGRPLPGRENIVITRDPDYAATGVTVVVGIDDALAVATNAARGGRIMVIGGGQIYAATLSLATEIVMTKVHACVDGDTWFPELDMSLWLEVSREDCPPERHGEPAFSFVTLKKRTGTTA